MMNKKFIRGTAVLILAFALAAVGCKDGSTEEDTWTDVAELSQINGKWKGSFKQDPKPVKDVMEQFGLPWDKSMAGAVGDMEVAVDILIVMTINASEKTQSQTKL